MSTRRITKRFGYVAAGLLVATATIAAVGAAIAATSGSDPRTGGGGHTGHPVTYAGATQGIRAAHAPLAAAKGQVLQGLSDTAVKGVQATSSPKGLVVRVALKQNNDDVPDVWVADLAVGALGERTRTNQSVINEEIASATAVGPGSNGTRVTSTLGLGAVRLGQVFGWPSDAVLKSHVKTVARQFGLMVSSLSILHPLESALRVTFVVPTSAKIKWTIDELRAALVGATPDVEGVLIQLDNPAGKPLLISGVAYRTGEGGLWFAPGQDERFGALHGGTPGK
jgi:hypothetical protein